MIDAVDMMPTERRFWSKVDIQRLPNGTPDFDKCWPWKGCMVKGGGHEGHCGYGQFRVSHNPDVRVRAHRYAYELFYGEQIPASQDGAHECDHPPCCNPTHIKPEWHQQNWRDFVRKYGSKEGKHKARAHRAAASGSHAPAQD